MIDIELSEIHESSQQSDEDHEETIVDIKSSMFGAIFNFINSIVGAGIIGLAFAIKESGFIMGIILLILAATLTDYTVRMIIKLGVVHKKRNYEDLCYFALGNAGYYTVTIMMFLFAYGAMIAYLIIIGDTIPKVIDSYGATVNRELIITLFACVFILPLTLLRNMASLQFTSGLSLAAVCMLVFIVLIRAPVAAHEQNIEIESNSFEFIRPNVFAGLGAMSFSFVCHHSTFIVYDSLDNPTWERWVRATHVSVGSALSISFILAVGGYISFLEHTQGDILNNFRDDDKLINIARLLLASTMIFTFPMEQFVARHCLYTILQTQQHYTITLVLFLSSLMIALAITDLGIVLELTGALSASIIAYILPILCFFRLNPVSFRVLCRELIHNLRHRHLRKSFDTLIPILIFIFGIVALFVGTIQAIMKNI